METKNIKQTHNLVYNSEIELAHNSMLLKRPILFKEWDFEENNKLELNIYEIKQGSVLKVNWVCSKCKSKFQSRVDSRTRGGNCPYCTGQKVNNTNSLASLNADLAAQWHPTLNGDLTPHQVPCKTERKVWWECERGHSYESRVSERSKGKGCAYCFNKKVLVGFNDIWTTHPEVASLLLDSKEGYKYTFGSSKKIDFLCPNCKTIVKNKAISHVSKRGLSCQACSDGYSIPEKVMYSILSEIDVEFDFQKTFDWGQKKKYDFYIQDLNMIIETHGRQHIEEGFQIGDAKSLKEEIENDIFKMENAILNGIEQYIVLDCYSSDLDYIKKSILSSNLKQFFDLNFLDWNSIFLKTSKSILVEVCKLYQESNLTHKEIANIFKINDGTVRKYLQTGAKLGLCDYSANSQKVKYNSIRHFEKEVVQLNFNGELVAAHSSIRAAGRSINKKSTSSISSCCRGRSSSSYGYLWMFKEDYENSSLRNNTIELGNNKKIKGVIQMSLEGIFIKEYKTMTEAQKETGALVGTIGKCCNGEYSQTKGFKWMYKEDYDKNKKVF